LELTKKNPLSFLKKMKKEIEWEIDLTPEELAEIFWEMEADKAMKAFFFAIMENSDNVDRNDFGVRGLLEIC